MVGRRARRWRSSGAVRARWRCAALGTARVVLRYLERLVTHTATFRALADLRVWFFRRLAANRPAGSASARPATCWRAW